MSIAMKKQIGLWGCQVKCAENFQNIISEFTEFDPQLVLLDIMLIFYIGYYIVIVRIYDKIAKS